MRPPRGTRDVHGFQCELPRRRIEEQAGGSGGSGRTMRDGSELGRIGDWRTPPGGRLRTPEGGPGLPHPGAGKQSKRPDPANDRAGEGPERGARGPAGGRGRLEANRCERAAEAADPLGARAQRLGEGPVGEQQHGCKRPDRGHQP